jgi:hypothetical protein
MHLGQLAIGIMFVMAMPLCYMLTIPVESSDMVPFIQINGVIAVASITGFGLAGLAAMKAIGLL